MKVDIAVPTYNSAAWFDVFMESVLAQDDGGILYDWRIITRDDNSADGTVECVQLWAEKLAGRIMVLPNVKNATLGPAQNYNAVLQAATAPYVMLADPDDIWKPDKMQLCMAAMIKMEAAYGADIPALVISDAEVIDGAGQIVAQSYWKWQRMQPAHVRRFNRLLMESPAISSAMTLNRAALQRALPIKNLHSSQDWWLTLVVCAFGNIGLLYPATIKHRRHDLNFSKTPLLRSKLSVAEKIYAARQRLEFLLNKNRVLSDAFLENFAQALTGSQRNAVLAVIDLPGANALARRLFILREKLWFGYWLKNLALLFLL